MKGYQNKQIDRSRTATASSQANRADLNKGNASEVSCRALRAVSSPLKATKTESAMEGTMPEGVGKPDTFFANAVDGCAEPRRCGDDKRLPLKNLPALDLNFSSSEVFCVLCFLDIASCREGSSCRLKCQVL